MTQETKHSKLPFHMIKDEVCDLGYYTVLDNNGKVVCTTEWGSQEPPKEADAELFVEACNSHYQLKEQNKMLTEALHKIADFGHAKDCAIRDYVPVYECGCYGASQSEIARKVLAKVKPKSNKE